MVTDYSGSTVLRKYELDSEGEKSYILGFPYLITSINRRDIGYSGFSKEVITKLKEKSSLKGRCDLLVEQSANEAVVNNAWNFNKSLVKDGYYFPSPTSGDSPGSLQLVKRYLRSSELVNIQYNSVRPGSSGESIVVKKLYVGQITAISKDETLATVKVNDSEYRNFRIAQILSLNNFVDKLTSGEMLYLHLTFTPRPKGGTLLTWKTIRGESHPFMAQPFHKDSDNPKKTEPVEAKVAEPLPESVVAEVEPELSEPPKKSEEKFEDFLLPLNGEVNWSALEAQLGKFIRVEVYRDNVKRTTCYFKLKSVRYSGDGTTGVVILKGKDVHVEESLKNLVIASVNRK